VTIIVDRLPDDLFEAPSPPPSLAAHESTDSLGDLGTIMVPANAQETARINIIREMVETERKYVQDLEVMQVRPHTPAMTLGSD
jgi:cell division control protein 24